jgi:hypothetical protein
LSSLLQAVTQKRKHHKTLAKAFTKEAEKFLGEFFHEVAQSRLQALKTEGVSVKKPLAEATTHTQLLRYSEILRLLFRMNKKSFEGLKDKYIAQFKKVYETKTKMFFSALKKVGGQSSYVDTRMAAFPGRPKFYFNFFRGFLLAALV